MEFLERDLEDIIFKSPLEELDKRGLDFLNGFLFRQVEIPGHGIADLINYTRPNVHRNWHSVKIIELKKGCIDESAFFQALRYAQGIRNVFKSKSLLCEIQITLIGKSIDTRSGFVFTPQLIRQDSFNQINQIEFMTYSYAIDGLRFNSLEEFYIDTNGRELNFKSKSKRIINYGN